MFKVKLLRGKKLVAKNSITWENNIKNVNIDITNYNITLADLVAHAVGINKPENIITVLDKLKEKDFKKKINFMKKRWPTAILSESNNSNISDIHKAFKTLVKMIELRYIVTNEITHSHIKNQEKANYDDRINNFVSTLEEFINELLYNTTPITQIEINEYAEKLAVASIAKMGLRIKQIRTDISNPEVLNQFDKSQKTWKKFIKQQAKVKAGYIGKHVPGKIALLFYSDEIKKHIDERLNWWTAGDSVK